MPTPTQPEGSGNEAKPTSAEPSASVGGQPNAVPLSKAGPPVDADAPENTTLFEWDGTTWVDVGCNCTSGYRPATSAEAEQRAGAGTSDGQLMRLACIRIEDSSGTIGYDTGPR